MRDYLRLHVETKFERLLYTDHWIRDHERPLKAIRVYV